MTSIQLSEKVLIPTRFKVNLRTCRAIRILVQELMIPKISWSKIIQLSTICQTETEDILSLRRLRANQALDSMMIITTSDKTLTPS